MNPAKALSFLRMPLAETEILPTPAQTLSLWARSMNVSSFLNDTTATKGVRSALKTLFTVFSEQKKQVWIPEDVYPVYWSLAQDAGLSPKSFSTLNGIDMDGFDNAASSSALLIPHPLMPLGRKFTDDESHKLSSWLKQSSDRRLVIDAVYTYDTHFDGKTKDFLEDGQTYVLHSLSKGWLEPGAYGTIVCPPGDGPDIHGRFENPDASSLKSVFDIMSRQPDLPCLQEKKFEQEWKYYESILRNADPKFEIPPTGYFSTLRRDHLSLLEKFNILAVPASVFGSDEQNISVVSCLHDMSLRPR